MSSPEPENTQWFIDEVRPHEPSLRCYLHNAFPSVRDVDDVIQESYLRVWRARAVRPILSAKAFLFQVARHLALDLVRRSRTCAIDGVTDLNALFVLEGGPDAAEAACTRQEILVLAEAIDSLPARCRDILILRKLKGVSQKEIAMKLGISEQTVQVQAARGIKRCEAYLRRRGIGGASEP